MLRDIHELSRPVALDKINASEQRPEREDRASGVPDSSLDETARDERSYVRGRLKEELGREPTEQEVDDWLRHHTEGY